MIIFLIKLALKSLIMFKLYIAVDLYLEYFMCNRALRPG